ncbi:hypothetical protein PMIT1313_00939 [Prochlorococcus marinus str. MIT 1313]|uniref:Nif11-like leader peptide family natural product precursor n=1 Tax=Prochlorococcus TaxID=1218 RepID=UPI0007B34E6B|nr:Nif11-like leader peptide family natural product precursor [Prochlorococcus marinus]KZR69832.1 hypothetical protein PMIT1313_00939 [Prochlorococcus marinus str. MIT 1313]KZR72180.1 hypothetical protein PMIT1318_01238 [Prochlorococcus marinus str. MIT 1318]
MSVHPAPATVNELFSVEGGEGWLGIEKALCNAKSSQECVEIAKKAGYNFTAEQFETYFSEHMTPEQLSAAMGGGNACCCCC